MLPIDTRTRRGFTLIELLVSIAIVAVLSTVAFTVFTQSQKLARDSKRKQDLKQIKNALTLYFQDFKHYPCVDNNGTGWRDSSSGGFWFNNQYGGGFPSYCGSATSVQGFDSNYIDSLPRDPYANAGNPATATTNYGYAYWGGNVNFSCSGKSGYGSTFVLVTQLENISDPDRVSARQVNHCGANVYNASGNTSQGFIVSPNAFALTPES